MRSQKNVLSGWRYGAFIGCVVGSIALAAYPVIVQPYLDPKPWQDMSRRARESHGIKQENIQPGNMKVWSDPFDRPGKPGHKKEE